MNRDSKKQVKIRILLIFFTILAITGLGILGQVFVRQLREVKENDQAAASLESRISELQDEMNALEEQKGSLEAEKEDLETLKLEKEEEAKAKDENGVEGLYDLKAEIQSFMKGRAGTWSIYVKNLSEQEYLSYNNQPLKAASLIKLYIMGAVYEQIEKGNLEMTDSIYTLLNDMITVSDNESSNELVRQLSETRDNFEEGMAIVNQYASANGYEATSQGRDLRDYREVPAEGENYTSVVDCGRFLESVYNGTNVSESASMDMLNFLKNQTRRNKIPAGLPEGTASANKTGELSDTENDAAIVYSENGPDYIICVMSQDLPDTGSAQAVIQELSRMVYDYFTGTIME